MPRDRPRLPMTMRFRHLWRRLALGFWFKLASATFALLAAHALIMGALVLLPRAGLSLAFLMPPAATSAAAASCGWTEPPRTYPEGARWSCVAVGWMDGDTLAARCDGHDAPVSVRLRGVDTDERGQGRWEEAREELRRRTAGHPLAVLPRHRSHQRVVADVLAVGVNVGAAMDAAGWSKAECPKR